MADTPSSVKRKDTRFVQGGTTVVKEKSVGYWEPFADFNVRHFTDITIPALPEFYEGRPDLLSYDIYGSNNLEWVILLYNNIVDINEEFVAGVTIVMPSKGRLLSSMLIKTVNYESNDV